MSFINKPKVRHPDLPQERARADAPRLRGRDVDALRRLRPRHRHRVDHRGDLGSRDPPGAARQAVGNRLLVEDDRVLRERRARLQRRARPHAVRRDRRECREQEPLLHRRLGRRRFAVDRLRPVRARDPPQCQHALHLREQRRLRPDQGPVLGFGGYRQQDQEGRGEPAGAGRPGARSAVAWRVVHRAQLLGRSRAAGAADQGGPHAQGFRADRRHLAVRDLQRPRGLDEELRVHARALRARR